jgi:hypothetical protein
MIRTITNKEAKNMGDILASLVTIIGGKVVYDNTDDPSIPSTASVCFMAGAIYVLLVKVLGAVLEALLGHFGHDMPDNPITKVVGQTTLITSSFVAAIAMAEEINLLD